VNDAWRLQHLSEYRGHAFQSLCSLLASEMKNGSVAA